MNKEPYKFRVDVYKVDLQVFDFQNRKLDDIIQQLQNLKYINTHVRKIEHKIVEDFHDDHPLNKIKTGAEEYQKLFRNERHEFIDSLSDAEFEKLKKLWMLS